MISSRKGNVLLYVVVLMLIFGVLGVVMVSLFTTTTASTVTQNDTRRAIYMAESAVRYAFSELRKEDFDQDFILNDLSAKPYNVIGAGSFEIKLLNPWFFPTAFGVNQVTLTAPVVNIPANYAPPGGAYVVNFHSINPNFSAPGANSQILNPVSQTDNTMVLDLAVGDDLIARSDEQISFAVMPTGDPPYPKTVNNGDSLVVAFEAQNFFPPRNGAISIYKRDYAYEERIDDPDGNFVTLTNLSALSNGEFPVNNVDTTTFVVLSPSNYIVAPEGRSENVIYGGTWSFSNNIFNPNYSPHLLTADIPKFTSESPLSTPGFITLDSDAGTLNVGSGVSGGASSAFGSVFFDADRDVGGEQDYCQQGACKFFLGVRVFFLLDFASQGDGLTFTLTNAATNSEVSAGGDIDLSELMAYGGDSRTDSAGSTFLATAPADRGLNPPKIAVEFDTRTNNMVGDPPPDYCSGADVNTDTRNDPLTSNQDAVQYVFWGRRNFLNIPCRGDSALYDDNRHDALGEGPIEEWRFGTGAEISIGRPAIGPDGTIYMSALDATLYALNEDGSTKWTFSLGVPPGGNNDYMPGVDRTGGPNDGTIYSDISGDAIVAINPDGTEKWRTPMGADFDSTPIVASDGTIFFGSDGPPNAIFAFNPNGTEKWQYNTGDNVDTTPALSPDESIVYAVSEDNNLYAVNVVDGTLRWRFPIPTEPLEITSSPVVNPNDGTIYVGTDPDAFGDSYVYALNPAARTADPNPVGLGTFPQPGEWRFGPIGEVESSAFLDPNDGTIYIGSDDNYVYAINPNGTQKWRFLTGGAVESSPIVDVDGTVYVGSSDNNVYALKPDARLADFTDQTLDVAAGEWAFATGDNVPSSPVLGKSGFIHIGSDDTNFYTISQYADPRNFKDENKSLGKLLTYVELGIPATDLSDTDDWLNGKPGIKGPYAVRMEVDRDLADTDADGFVDYQLSLWIRQCQELDCSDINGTFFSDTRLDYQNAPAGITLPMIQQFRLDGAPGEDHDKFDRFYFGFTGATGPGQIQDALISQFNLSFIREGDPVIDVAAGQDPNWPP